MIKKIIIQDFFSFKGINEISLNPGLNVLLGINGSGKTTFLNAFKLLYEGVAGGGFERLFQAKWGGYHSVVNANQEETPECIKITYVFDKIQVAKLTGKKCFKNDPYYEITIRPVGATSYSLEEKLYSANSKNHDSPFVYLEVHQGVGKLSVWHSNGIRNEFQKFHDGDMSSHELALRQISDPRRYLPMHSLKTVIASMALYESFNTSSDSPLRRPSNGDSAMRLYPNGENLIQLLSNLKTSYTRDYDKIERQLNSVNPHFQSFDFSPYAAQIYLSVKEDNMSHTIGMQHLSDGTIRYMLLLAILMNPNSGALIGTDEPEGRLHPDMINSVAKLLIKKSQESQLIVATHSPLLLNAFTLEDVLVFEKDECNASQIKRYYESDFEHYEGNILPGMLWLRGEIGGKRW